MLANNILSRSFAALAGPLHDAQIAPVGFLYLVKAGTAWLGTSEHILRLVPFVAGIASIFLFWAVASHMLPRAAALLALAMFAVSPRLIYYSSELKQYSGDVAVSLAVLLIAMGTKRHGYPPAWLGALAAVCAAAVWISQPAVFVITGVLAALLLDRILNRDRSAVARLAAAGLVAGISFWASFALAHAALAGSTIMPTFWAAGFLPLPPTSAAEVWAWPEAFIRAFRDPTMFSIPLIAVAAFVCGIAELARRRETTVMVMLVAPVLLTMLAAGLHLYPFGDDIFYGGRVLLFLVPLFLIPVALGVDAVRRLLRVRPAVFAVLVAVALAIPRLPGEAIASVHARFPATASYLMPSALPPMRMEWQDPRPLLRQMSQHTRPDDLIYVFDIAGPPFRYYAPRFGVAGNWVRGNASGGDPAAAAAEIEMLRGHSRVWLFFAYAHGNRHVPFVEHATRIGEPIMVLEHEGTATVLYDLSLPEVQ